MPKTKIAFACQECGAESAKWLGRCPDCGAWNSYVEEAKIPATARAVAGGQPSDARARSSAGAPERLVDVSLQDSLRIPSGMVELDRVLGGGIVPGSLVLIGGDPGIGKSTLLLQAAANVAAGGSTVLYVSGEESARQVRLRAERLTTVSDSLYVLAETSLDAALAHVEQLNPALMIVDSIQTAYLEDVASSPGNVAQLRECTLRLMNVAKARELPIFLVGHVTKEGNIAGPRVLEHIVDCVLYLEGERFYSYRLLRAAKNRFGSTNEVGVFEMDQGGMKEVANPSAAFLSERAVSSSGSAVTVPLEGTRALLVEVQALVAGTAFGAPRRTAVGIDHNRLALLTAVLAKRLGLPLGSQDVYVNVVAGLKVPEPATDLGVALAIGSSARDVPIDSGLVVVGEIGLAGELRVVSQVERRLSEAARLGFERAIVPAGDYRRLTEGGGSGAGGSYAGMSLYGAATVAEAYEIALGPAPAKAAAPRSNGARAATGTRRALQSLIDESLLEDEP